MRKNNRNVGGNCFSSLIWSSPFLLFLFQMTYYRGTGEMYIGGIKSHKYNDNRCLTDRGEKKTEPGLFNCKEAMQKGMGIYWDFTQVRLQNQFRLTALFKRKLLSFWPFLKFCSREKSWRTVRRSAAWRWWTGFWWSRNAPASGGRSKTSLKTFKPTWGAAFCSKANGSLKLYA